MVDGSKDHYFLIPNLSLTIIDTTYFLGVKLLILSSAYFIHFYLINLSILGSDRELVSLDWSSIHGIFSTYGTAPTLLIVV